MILGILIILAFTLPWPFLIYITFYRSAPPYKLSRWNKQLFETLFVLLVSLLAYVQRDDINGLHITMAYISSFMPMANLWWDCSNFGILDLLMALSIQAAAVLTVGYPYAPVALAVGGVSLQLLKNELLSN